MADPRTQDGRLLALETPLGKDYFLLASVSASEALSEPFRFDLEVLSEDMAVSTKDIVGSEVSIRLGRPEGQTRTVHGIVAAFSVAGLQIEGYRSYRMQVVPWLWLLSHSADCRIFQNLSVPEILQQVFQDHGFDDFELRIQRADYPPREFCVQYRETALTFISRLMEQEGLFYFFEHKEKRHLLVVTDNNLTFRPLPEERVICSDASGQTRGISRWEHVYAMRTGRRAFRDFNFEKPSTDLLSDEPTVLKIPRAQPLERYDYPGSYAELDRGKHLVRIQMQADEAVFHRVVGGSEYVQFTPGGRFTVAEHPIRSEVEGSYVLRRVRHEAREGSYFAGDVLTSYTNEFEAFPADTPFRADICTPKPCVQGPQTAVVVGPPGEEILTDKYGRVKLHFHWDRLGRRDEKSSCWVRVSQSWAGSGYGFIQIPRIGQEVIVEFLEGDPDRPIVTGRVYNAEQMPPHGLPGAAVKSGLKSNSTKGGGGSNELTLDDTKGSEQIYFHAQKNLDSVVENDETRHVKANRTTTVDVDETQTVGGNETIHVIGNRGEAVDQHETLLVALTRTHTVGLADTLTVGAARTHTVGAAEAITVGAARSVTVGGSQTVQIARDQEVAVGDDQRVSVAKDETHSVGKKLTISAGDQIVLKTGSATLTMKKNGDIIIQGKQITIKGSGDVVIKGKKILEN